MSVHVSRDATSCISFPSSSGHCDGRPAQSSGSSAHGHGCCFRFRSRSGSWRCSSRLVAASALLPVQATRDPISCVPLAHPFASSAVGACAGQITVASYGNRGRMGPCPSSWDHVGLQHAVHAPPVPLQFLFVHSGRGSQIGSGADLPAVQNRFKNQTSQKFLVAARTRLVPGNENPDGNSKTFCTAISRRKFIRIPGLLQSKARPQTHPRTIKLSCLLVNSATQWHAVQRRNGGPLLDYLGPMPHSTAAA